MKQHNQTAASKSSGETKTRIASGKKESTQSSTSNVATIRIKSGKSIEAFALVADINGFTRMVSKGEEGTVAFYVRDVLVGGVSVVEEYGGEVVCFMGDAFLAVLPTAQSVVDSCRNIAKDIDRTCEYVSNAQAEHRDTWGYARGGPALKIGVEFGKMDVAEIRCRTLGSFNLVIGNAINYASRIKDHGTGNRCNVGPVAKGAIEPLGCGFGRQVTTKGKPGEVPYKYWRLDLTEIWREGTSRRSGSYWG